MKIATVITRVLMGLPLLACGANFSVGFLPLAFEGTVEESEFAPEEFQLLKAVYESG